jgi:AraC-like DNA-binding protein
VESRHSTEQAQSSGPAAEVAPVKVRRELQGLDYPCYSARFAAPFLELLGGLEGLRAFAAVQALDPDERIPIATCHALLETVIETTGEVDLGLKAGCRMSRGDAGAVDYAMSSAATLADAIRMAARYATLFNDALEIRLETHGDRAAIRMHSQVVLPKVAADFMLSAFYHSHLVPELEQAPELECWVMHAAPADASEYERTFAPAKVCFAKPWYGFVFDQSRLQAPLHGADAKLHSVVRKYADALLAGLPKAQSLTEKVRTLIARELPQVQPSAECIARQLRMSSRTLSRRLEDEGTSFRALVDDLRRGLALQYLANPRLAVAEVAFLLGFSEVAAFHRAFRRWTGKTPLEHRRSERA